MKYSVNQLSHEAQNFFLIRKNGEKFALMPFTTKSNAIALLNQFRVMYPEDTFTTDIELEEAPTITIHNLCAIEKATTENIVDVESQFIRLMAQIESNPSKLNNNLVDKYKWYEEAKHACEWELKRRGVRKLSDWELLLS